MPKAKHIFIGLLVGLFIQLGSSFPVAAQEVNDTVDLSDVVQVVSSDVEPAEQLSDSSTSTYIAQQNSPMMQLAQRAAQFLNSSNSSEAAFPNCPVMKGGGRAACGISKILTGENAITDDQFEQFYQIGLKMKDEMGPLKLDCKKNKRHLKDEMTKEELDTKAIKKLQGNIANLKRDMTQMKLDYKLQMAQVLTGTQRAELRKAMIKWACMKKYAKKMKCRWMKRRGRCR